MTNTLKREQLQQIARKHGTDLRNDQYPEWFNWHEDQILAAMEEAVAMAVERCTRHTPSHKEAPPTFDECKRLRSELEAARERYDVEYSIVNRVWAALGISDYEGAGGKAIDEIVSTLKQQNERLREALKSIGGNSCCDSCYEAAKVARAALAADQSEEVK